MITIFFNKLEVLDWYDGVIRAVGFAETGCYLIILVAWDMNQPAKLYVLVHLSEAEQQEIFEALNSAHPKEKNWEEFESMFDRFIQTYADKAYTFLGDVEAGKSYTLRGVKSDKLRSLASYDFEATLNEANIYSWFDLWRGQRGQ